MTDEELYAEILKLICEEEVEKDQEPEQTDEQMSELIEDLVHSGENQCFGEYNLKTLPRSLIEGNSHSKSSTICPLLIFFLFL